MSFISRLFKKEPEVSNVDVILDMPYNTYVAPPLPSINPDWENGIDDDKLKVDIIKSNINRIHIPPSGIPIGTSGVYLTTLLYNSDDRVYLKIECPDGSEKSWFGDIIDFYGCKSPKDFVLRALQAEVNS